MSQSFYFYDLETSSGSPRTGRIMQFAGQRTDLDLAPIGEPDNFLVRLAPDVLPEPEAILVHHITPQQTLQDGISEAELVEYFEKNILKPDTIFAGYNSIRFDDEFMRGLFYRSLIDPYGWQWQRGCSRWDLLDPIRMMRALRPKGLEWPFAPNGSPTVSLGAMTAVNNIEHANAHDALGDIQALIDLTKRFKNAQPRLFSYLLSVRDKKKVALLVESRQPFIYSSGKYSGDYLKTTVVVMLTKHPKRGSAVVYNLREDPAPYIGMSPVEIAKRWREYDPKKRLPIKTLQYNRAPAIAPMGVLDDQSRERLVMDTSEIEKYLTYLKKHPEFTKNIEEAIELLDQQQGQLLPDETKDVDQSMYDGFWTDADKRELEHIRGQAPEKMIGAASRSSEKIKELTFRFIARNYPSKLTSQQRQQWEEYIQRVLLEGGDKSRLSLFANRLTETSKRPNLSEQERYLLTELQLYVESTVPEI